jgi:hypothetical protein
MYKRRVSPKHVDITWSIDRTLEELTRVTYNFMEVDRVLDGYPELDQRLYVPTNQPLPFEIGERIISGYDVRIVHLPGGFDATQSPYRAGALANKTLRDQFLFGPADPDHPTGDDWHLPDNHPAVQRALANRCRDFTQHLQPLIPGWRQLLGLQTKEGDPLGMPTGIGFYTHYGTLPMCDAVTLRPNEDHDDLEVLMYWRADDEQSAGVWATPGGYVTKTDANHRAHTPLQATSTRRTQFRTNVDLSRFSGMAPIVKYPISSGSTLSACLATRPFVRYIPNARLMDDMQTDTVRWVSMRDLCDNNPTGGISGDVDPHNQWPIWTTHFEYIVAGIDAISDPENRHAFDITLHEQAIATRAVSLLRRDYDIV